MGNYIKVFKIGFIHALERAKLIPQKAAPSTRYQPEAKSMPTKILSPVQTASRRTNSSWPFPLSSTKRLWELASYPAAASRLNACCSARFEALPRKPQGCRFPPRSTERTNSPKLPSRFPVGSQQAAVPAPYGFPVIDHFLRRRPGQHRKAPL